MTTASPAEHSHLVARRVLVRSWTAAVPARVRQLAGHRENGSQAIQFVALLGPLLLLLMVVVGVHRAASDNLAVDAAAYDAARAASIARTASEAQSAAQSAADASLAQTGLVCADRSVTLNLAGFTVAVGQPATVSATVSCTATSAGLPGLIGSKSFSSTAVSPLDSYRERS